MTARLRWLRARRPLMLRTRFTLAAAGAVAAVTLAVTAVAFLVLRSDLQDQVKEELREQSAVVHREAQHYHGHIPSGWVPPHSDRFGVSTPYMQVVTARGAVWAPPGGAGLLAASAAADQVAAGRHVPFYAGTTVDGIHAMVFTTSLAPGLAVQLAAPLDQVDNEVTSVGTTLALLSAMGVVLAALAGRAVARAGLAPVGRLAAVAEQVTATGNPARRVEVDRADELGRLATSFNTMLGALERSLSAQRQLVSDASHELRTPLTSLRLNAELLAADRGPDGQPALSGPDRREVLDRVIAQVAELGQLVASITELARGESQPGPSGETVPLHEVVEAGLAGARRDWPRTLFLADLEPCVVVGHTEGLQVAVRNLLDNAAKFGPPGARVEVRLRAGELAVRDHGPGIAPTDLPHVFDRFYRAPAARGVPGSGLGLAIVGQVAERHGGTVRAEAPPGGGTLIRLRLPALVSPVPGGALASASGAAQVPDAALAPDAAVANPVL